MRKLCAHWCCLNLLAIGLVLPASASAPTRGVSPGAVDREAAIRSPCPTFSWSAVLGAESFELLVYQLPATAEHIAGVELSADREALFARVMGSASGWTPELERCLEPGGSYIWFVRAVMPHNDSREPGEWSEGRFFRVAATPTAEEIEQALDGLRRFAAERGAEIDGSRIRHRDERPPARQASRPGLARPLGSPKAGQRSVPSASAAVRAEGPGAIGETYGLAGISNSLGGAGMGAVNSAGGADLVLDGSAQGTVDTELSESGIDRPSATAEIFDIRNSGGGRMTLRLDGFEVVTADSDRDTLGDIECDTSEVAKWNGSSWACATDDDTAPRQPGNQLALNGNALDVIEGPDSGLDADTLDGLPPDSLGLVGHHHDNRYYTETELSSSGAGGTVHWDNLTSIPTGFADGIDDVASYTLGPGLMEVDGKVVLDPAAFQTRITTLDSAGLVGMYTSLAIGADGLGLISYYDQSNGDLKVAHCTNSLCSSAAIFTVDQGGPFGDVGSHTSIAIGADGLGLISYHNATTADLKVAHCLDTACTSATTSTIDSTGDVGQYTSLAIGADGLGLVSYYDQSTNGDLKVAHCTNTSCSSAAVFTVDPGGLLGDVGSHTSVAIGSDGLGLISYYDASNDTLKVAHCDDIACSAATATTVDDGGSAGHNVGQYTSLAIGADGLGLISYYDVTDSALKVAHCDDTVCTSAQPRVVDSSSDVGWYTSLAIGADGLGLISYLDAGLNGDLKVAHCNDWPCGLATVRTEDHTPVVGMYSSLAIGADGHGLISYHDVSNFDLKVAHLPIGY